jgi:hypothetical protein
MMLFTLSRIRKLLSYSHSCYIAIKHRAQFHNKKAKVQELVLQHSLMAIMNASMQGERILILDDLGWS